MTGNNTSERKKESMSNFEYDYYYYYGYIGENNYLLSASENKNVFSYLIAYAYLLGDLPVIVEILMSTYEDDQVETVRYFRSLNEAVRINFVDRFSDLKRRDQY